MMKYISSVKYKILINRQPKRHIISKRELRQEDLLSSYLFILGMKALIVNIQKEEKKKY